MKAIAGCLVFLYALIMVAGSSDTVLATGAASWVDGPATVLRTSPVSTLPDSTCPTYRQDLFIPKLGAAFGTCMHGDERLKIGTIIYEGSVRAVVQFRYSPEVHPLDGVCGNVDCQYSAETDTLVTVQRIGRYTMGLVVFKNVSDRIKESRAPMMPMWYVFDATNPDYTITDNNGAYIATQSYNISENGKWIVVELRDRGIALIETETLTARHIVTEGYKYGYGMDPHKQLAVSNDGKSVAVAGRNAGFNVFNVSPMCGQQLVDGLLFQYGTIRCSASDLQVGTFFPNVRTVERPRFVGNGRSLEVLVSSRVHATMRVLFATNGTPISPQLRFLSLGDSFSSGEGEIDDRFYLPGTNDGINKCHVSSRAYPAIVALGMGAHQTNAKNIACSGARMADIFGSPATYKGQGGRLGVSGLDLSDVEMRAGQEQAMNSFLPGKVLQADFIERYTPENITIGIGGNDAGLMGKLNACAMPGICEWAVGEGIAKTAGEISRLYDGLVGLFAKINTIAHDARVFVVGYPSIINPSGNCDAVTSFLIHPTERKFIQKSTQYLNQVIKSAANTAGFTYINIENSLLGRQLCDGGASPAMNGLRLGDDISIIRPLPMLKIIGAETFHPTPAGHQLIAQDFLRSNVETPQLPIAASGAPEPAAYWKDVIATTSSAQAYVSDFAERSSGNPGHLKIHLPSGSLQPNSRATIEIRSERMVLAEVSVGDNGGFDGEMTLPGGLPEGFHTLHIFGNNREGDQVDLYQFVTIGNLNESGEVSAATRSDESRGTSIRNPGVKLTLADSSNQAPALLPASGDRVVSDGRVLGASDVARQPFVNETSFSHNKSDEDKNSSDGGLVWGVTAVAGFVVFAVIIWLLRKHWAKPPA